ncbi:glycosyltransferase [Pseudonocardia bannensis]|uniref:Glycosyltransferase family 28 n=1 Tax=Pseudonocardia bannensis TaxID=630973 RepID=A0A848DF02_9PSEU|nr:glycosyltransferase [Pseudonocardia bannensis]NMH91133.1 glycosyltransferase family 28 [Pseudonocardia bannensis]
MTTLFLATTGGHLRQLAELSERIAPEGDALWVTNADHLSTSILCDRTAHFVADVHPRDVRGVLRCVPTAHRLWREWKITRAISTGSGIALGYLPYLAARGVSCHYVESATRVVGPSLTGRLLGRIPLIRLYSQYTGWAGRRWMYAGNIFDSYQPTKRFASSGDELRVVVTLGIATGFPFRRLVEHLIPLLTPDGPLARAVDRRVRTLWQTAGTEVDDLPIRALPSIPSGDFATALRRADIVVSHAGTGSAVAALEQGRYPILAPRASARGEIGDDHQKQLGAELTRRGLALVREPDAITVDDLIASMSRAIMRNSSPPPFRLRP